MNRTEYLRSEEISELKTLYRNSFITGFIGSVMMYILIHIFILLASGTLIVPKYEIIIIVGLPVVFYLFTYLVIRPLRKDISSGMKVICNKTIQEKYDYIDKEDRFSPEKRKYAVVADNQKYFIEEAEYLHTKPGDTLEIHMTSFRNEILIKRVKRS